MKRQYHIQRGNDDPCRQHKPRNSGNDEHSVVLAGYNARKICTPRELFFQLIRICPILYVEMVQLMKRLPHRNWTVCWKQEWPWWCHVQTIPLTFLGREPGMLTKPLHLQPNACIRLQKWHMVFQRNLFVALSIRQTCSLPQNNCLLGSTQWYKYTLLLQVWSLTYIIHVQGCIYLQIYVRKRKSVIIHTPSLAWNVNRMAYNEGGQKMHGRKKGLRMLTYDGEDYKQNKAHKEAVSCNWASSAPPRHSFALRLVHRNCSTPSALEHWWKFGKNHPQATTPACGFPSHALLHVRLYRHHIHILKFPGHIAHQICIVVATHDGHPVLAPAYHSLIWVTCPNIHVTGQKGEWLDSKQ